MGASSLALQLGESAPAVDLAQQAVALARQLDDSVLLAKSLQKRASTLTRVDLNGARRSYEESLTIEPVFPAMINLTSLLIHMRDLVAARTALGRAEAFLRENPPLATPYHRMFLHHRRAMLLLEEGRISESEREVKAFRRLAQELDNRRMQEEAAFLTGELRVAEGRFVEAAVIAQDNLLWTARTQRHYETLALFAKMCVALGRLSEARVALLECLPEAPLFDLPGALEAAAALLGSSSQAENAACLLGASSSQRRRQLRPILYGHLAGHEALLASIKEALGDGGFDAATAKGAVMDVEAARSYAIAALLS